MHPYDGFESYRLSVFKRKFGLTAQAERFIRTAGFTRVSGIPKHGNLHADFVERSVVCVMHVFHPVAVIPHVMFLINCVYISCSGAPRCFIGSL